MPKFSIGEICLIIRDLRGAISPLECEIKAIEPDNPNGPYIIKVPECPCHRSLNGTWACPEDWLRKKPQPGADIVRQMIKEMPLSIIDDLEVEKELCTVKIIK